MNINVKRIVLCLVMATAIEFGLANLASYAQFPTTKAEPVQTFTAVIGKVTSVNPGAKVFKVASVLKGADGKEMSKQVDVRWSDRTQFIWKTKEKRVAAPSDLKVGTQVVVRTKAQAGGKLVATEVWVQPLTGSIDLTASECRDLGGTITLDTGCAKAQRCTVPSGSRCIDE